MKKTRLIYRVPYADTDKMGRVYYANYLVYFERVRNEMLRESGISYLEMENRGILLPVIEAHCIYKMPATYDDLLEVCGWFEETLPTRIRIACEIIRDNAILTTGYTVHACLSSEKNRPTKIPADVRQRLHQK